MPMMDEALARLVRKLNVETSSNHSVDNAVPILFEFMPEAIKPSCKMWLDPVSIRL
jgi:hypothetical protein